jgi:hypothetical protein
MVQNDKAVPTENGAYDLRTMNESVTKPSLPTGYTFFEQNGCVHAYVPNSGDSKPSLETQTTPASPTVPLLSDMAKVQMLSEEDFRTKITGKWEEHHAKTDEEWHEVLRQVIPNLFVGTVMKYLHKDQELQFDREEDRILLTYENGDEFFISFDGTDFERHGIVRSTFKFNFHEGVLTLNLNVATLWFKRNFFIEMYFVDDLLNVQVLYNRKIIMKRVFGRKRIIARFDRAQVHAVLRHIRESEP